MRPVLLFSVHPHALIHVCLLKVCRLRRMSEMGRTAEKTGRRERERV